MNATVAALPGGQPPTLPSRTRQERRLAHRRAGAELLALRDQCLQHGGLLPLWRLNRPGRYCLNSISVLTLTPNGTKVRGRKDPRRVYLQWWTLERSGLPSKTYDKHLKRTRMRKCPLFNTIQC